METGYVSAQGSFCGTKINWYNDENCERFCAEKYCLGNSPCLEFSFNVVLLNPCILAVHWHVLYIMYEEAGEQSYLDKGSSLEFGCCCPYFKESLSR